MYELERRSKAQIAENQLACPGVTLNYWYFRFKRLHGPENGEVQNISYWFILTSNVKGRQKLSQKKCFLR